MFLAVAARIAEHTLQVSQRTDFTHALRIYLGREQMLLHRRQQRPRVSHISCHIGTGVRSNRRKQCGETASAGKQKAAARQQGLPPGSNFALYRQAGSVAGKTGRSPVRKRHRGGHLSGWHGDS
ncbi:MAG: hypothetical protein Q8Q28_08160 [Pseudomonadota bacterium]|nr:hypothetical protein [Pseudomonadota bacterium]